MYVIADSFRRCLPLRISSLNVMFFMIAESFRSPSMFADFFSNVKSYFTGEIGILRVFP